MATRAVSKQRRRTERVRREAELAAARRQRARRLRTVVTGVFAAAVVGLGAIFALNAGSGSDSTAPGQAAGAGEYAYAVGDPGPGQAAPPLQLPSTTGGTFDLADQDGKTTLLYFQEGLGCQPCWDQIKDLERQSAKLHALGIDQMVSITGNELDQLRQKADDEGLRTPILADPGLPVSATYAANQYGMMGDSANGHSFIVVGPDGKIEFRADYGGEPNYTMHVPVENLFADIKQGMRGTT
jgi:peroxiredoxin